MFRPNLLLRVGSSLVGLLLLSQCGHFGLGGGKPAAHESEAVVQARDSVVTGNYDTAAVDFFAQVATELSRQAEAETPPVPENQQYVQQISKESLGYIDKALAKTTDPLATALLNARKGEMLLVQKDFTAADVVIRKGIELCPCAVTVEPMLRSLKLRDQAGEAAKWCKDARAHVCARADVAKLCMVCASYGADACDSPEDKDMLADKARLRVEAADAEQRRGTSTDPTVLLDAVASMPIVNLCPRSVNLFFGKELGGPGLVTSIDGKEKMTKRLQLHSKVWIVDAQGKAVSSIIVKNEFPAITINASGNGFE